MKTDTPRTDEMAWPETGLVEGDFARQLERELTTVTEQRDKAWQKIENQAERITYLEGATNHATGTPLSKAIEQRDRVAVMRQMWSSIEEDDYPNCNTPEFNAAILKYKQALQSLTPNEL